MNTNEILNTVDCTPTWEALIIPMLDLHGDLMREKVNFKGGRTIDQWREAKDTIITEFKKMAQAADKWNAHVKETK